MHLSLPRWQRVFDSRYMLLSKRIAFQSAGGEKVEMDVVYQDSNPEGNSRATVFALHGSPGSYSNFKHLVPRLKEKNIRFVAPNYPGHGLTPNSHHLKWTNDERNNFAEQLMDSLKLCGKKNLIFLGHSKGAPNALQLGSKHKEDTLGIVLLNSTGVLPHRGYRFSVAPNKLAQRMRKHLITRGIGEHLIHFSYNKLLKMKVPQKESAVVAAKNMLTFDFKGMIKDVDEFLSNDEIRLFLVFSGKDLLIEREVSEDLSKRFRPGRRLDYTKEKDQQSAEDVVKAFQEGNRIVAAFFEEDDHFVNNSRPETIANAIDVMMKIREGHNKEVQKQ